LALVLYRSDEDTFYVGNERNFWDYNCPWSLGWIQKWYGSHLSKTEIGKTYIVDISKDKTEIKEIQI
jgi:hypothetical protein